MSVTLFFLPYKHTSRFVMTFSTICRALAALVFLVGTSKNAQMSPNRGSGRHPASGFWRSVAPERLI